MKKKEPPMICLDLLRYNKYYLDAFLYTKLRTEDTTLLRT